MRLSLLPGLILPFLMLTLVNCTLVINSALDPEAGTGLGSGVVEVEDDIGTPLGTCTITDGVPQANCEVQIPPDTTVVLKPTAAGDSEFGGWTASSSDDVAPIGVASFGLPCDVLAGDECTIVFNNPFLTTIKITAYFKDLSCQGVDACLSLADPPGEGSCIGVDACFSANGPIGNNACDGNSACAFAYKSIGDNSCNGPYACYVATKFIGDNSCNGADACRQAAVYIGNNSCNTTGSDCREAIWPIFDCMYNDVTPPACEPEEED